MVELGIRLGDLELANPFIVAAGPPGATGASLKRMASGGPGAVVTKSIGVVPSGARGSACLTKSTIGTA